MCVNQPVYGWQLSREIEISYSLFEPKNLVTRNRFGRLVPRLPLHSPHPGSNLSFLPLSAMMTASICTVNRHQIGLDTRAYRVSRICVSMAFTAESLPTGTGPAVLKEAWVTGAAHHWDNFLCAPLSLHPLSYLILWCSQWTCARYTQHRSIYRHRAKRIGNQTAWLPFLPPFGA